MEKSVEISNRKIMKLDNKLVEAKLDLKSTEEMKIFGIVIAQIDVNDKEFKNYEIKIKDLEQLTGKKKNEKQIKALADKMLKKTCFIYDETGWIGRTIFSEIRYIRNESKLIISLHDKLRPFLLNLKQEFTKIDLLHYIHLDSGYSMKLYLLLKQYQTIGKRKFNVDQLREILQTPKSYQNFKDFKRKVLKISQKEINEKTDIKISWEITKKVGRKITEIEFKIEKKIIGIDKKKKENYLKNINNNIVNKVQNKLNNDLKNIDDFKIFRTKILKEYRTNVLVLDNQVFSIKGVYLALNDKVLKADEALEKWHLLFENKDKIQILNKEEYEKQQANKIQELQNKLDTIKNKSFYQVVDYGEFKDEFEFKILQFNDFDQENEILNLMFEMVEDRNFHFNIKGKVDTFYKYDKFILDPENNKFEWLK